MSMYSFLNKFVINLQQLMQSCNFILRSRVHNAAKILILIEIVNSSKDTKIILLLIST